jgi:hypothetical protein
MTAIHCSGYTALTAFRRIFATCAKIFQGSCSTFATLLKEIDSATACKHHPPPELIESSPVLVT